MVDQAKQRNKGCYEKEKHADTNRQVLFQPQPHGTVKENHLPASYTTNGQGKYRYNGRDQKNKEVLGRCCFYVQCHEDKNNTAQLCKLYEA